MKKFLLIILSAVIVSSAFAGIVLFKLGESSSSAWAEKIIQIIAPFGTVLISMLKMIVIPIIFFSLVSGSASLPIKKFGKIGIFVLLWHFATSLFAAFFGCILALGLNPEMQNYTSLSGKFVNDVASMKMKGESGGGFAKFLNELFMNPFQALAEGNFLPIIIFALLFGLAIRVLIDKNGEESEIGKSGNLLLQIFDICQRAAFKIIDWIYDWNKLNVKTWRGLLSNQPQFADKCDKLDEFSVWNWSELLQKQPQFADKCDKWDEFYGMNWSELLQEQPHFANKCHKWDELKPCYKEALLQAQPQFTYKLNTMLNRKYPTATEIHKAEALGLVFDKTGRVLRLCTNKNISEVVIPDGVSTIGQNMQRPSDERLIAAMFGDYSRIYDGFCNCVKLTTVVIPGSVKKITEGAFCNCKSLNTIGELWTKNVISGGTSQE